MLKVTVIYIKGNHKEYYNDVTLINEGQLACHKVEQLKTITLIPCKLVKKIIIDKCN